MVTKPNKRKRWLRALLLTGLCLLTLFGYRHYQLTKGSFTSGHALLQATSAVDGSAYHTFKANKWAIKNLEDQLKKYRLYATPQDSILVQKAKELGITTAQFDTISQFKIKADLYEKLFFRPSAQDLQLDLPEPQVKVEKLHPLLVAFLSQTQAYRKNEVMENRYNQLKNLTGTTVSEFYNRVFKDKKAYLVLAEMAVIRSLVASLEADYLARLKMELNNKYDYFGEANRKLHWLPVHPVGPQMVKAGDSLKFTAEIVGFPPLPVRAKTIFTVKEGKIDSIYNRTLAYVSIPVLPSAKLNHDKIPRHIPFAIKISYPNTSDTTFQSSIRINQKPE